jgi:hypothetical protein
MSKLLKYKESISKFIKQKSCYSNFLSENESYNKIIDSCDNMSSAIVIIVLNTLFHKYKSKSFHGFHISACVTLMMVIIAIKDNPLYYNEIYGQDAIDMLLRFAPIHIYDCIFNNSRTMENAISKDKITDIQKDINTYTKNTLINILTQNNFKKISNVKKTDLIKYNFLNKNIIATKYRHLKKIDKTELLNNVDTNYGSVCKFVFISTWLLGQGKKSDIPQLEKIGSSCGLLIKIINDFINVERDIEITNNVSSNLIINLGIDECFNLYDEHKNKFIEGCFILDIYNKTMKEIIDKIESTFNECLQSAEMDLKTQYSSFSVHS